jgi:hypothetical protein
MDQIGEGPIGVVDCLAAIPITYALDRTLPRMANDRESLSVRTSMHAGDRVHGRYYHDAKETASGDRCALHLAPDP